jgi:hypothetical protein
MAKSIKKSVAKKSSSKKAAPKKRVIDTARDKKIIALARKGVTCGEFLAVSRLYKSGSMLSNLKPVAKRAGMKLTHSGKHGHKVYKFVAGKA